MADPIPLGDYANIREVLFDFVGLSLLEVTQQEPGEPSYVVLHFSDGRTLRFSTRDGFDICYPDGTVRGAELQPDEDRGGV